MAGTNETARRSEREKKATKPFEYVSKKADTCITAAKGSKKRTYDAADYAAAQDLLNLSKVNDMSHLEPRKKRKVKHESPFEAAEGVASLAAISSGKPVKKSTRKATKTPKAATGNDDDGDENNASNNDDDEDKAIAEALVVCEGHPTGRGTTSVEPRGNHAQVDMPWHCANRDCSTGMTYLIRDEVPAKGLTKKVKGYGRKTISDYLGRNKKATKSIDPDVWHIYCRKCYQRLSYQAEKAGHVAQFKWHTRNLRIQFARLQIWRPEATFQIQLIKAMIDRGNEYQTILRKNKDNVAAAIAEYTSAGHKGADKRKQNVKGKLRNLKDEEAFPVAEVDNFIAAVCGTGKSYDDVERALRTIEDWFFVNKTITQMPPVEFLISTIGDGEIETETEANYQAWLDQLEDDRHSANVLVEAMTTSVVPSIEPPAIPLTAYVPPIPVPQAPAFPMTAYVPPAPVQQAVAANATDASAALSFQMTAGGPTTPTQQAAAANAASSSTAATGAVVDEDYDDDEQQYDEEEYDEEEYEEEIKPGKRPII